MFYKYFKKLVLIIATIFVLGCISKGWHFVSRGFATHKILPPQDCRCRCSEMPKDMPKEFFSIFDQEYSFLDKGCQVYVFEGQDKQHVIKFLRHHKYKPPFWITFLFFKLDTKLYKRNLSDYKKSRVMNAFNSYLMSYEELKKETAMVYVHLGTTKHLNKILTVRDKLGQKRYLDLDKSHFLVQKKVYRLAPILLELDQTGEVDRAKLLIDGYFQVVKNRIEKGIKNVDHSGYIRNMGVVDNRVVEMDVGGYRKNKDLQTKEGIKREYDRFYVHLKQWAEKRAPNLVEYIDQSSKKVLKDVDVVDV